MADVLGSRYQILAKLGTGAFGEVYKAHDTLLGRDVAIKRIRLEALADATQADEVKARFLREAQVAAQLKHPNIVTIHDIVSTPTMSFIVMELIEGVTLQSVLLKKKRLSLTETIDLIAQAAEALDHAHRQKVVHRDVKPANIMMEDSGRVKVTDFGIAKAESSGNLTATGSILGTPNYMSPEQAQGKPLDGRSDLFSLGCILYECLTGAKPFQEDSVTGILLRILNEDPQPIDHEKTGLPTAVDDVLRRALAKDPAARFPTGAALCRALKSIPSADAEARTVGLGPTQAVPVPVSRTHRHASAESTLPAPSTGTSSPPRDEAVTIRRARRGKSRKAPRRWLGVVALLAAIVLGLAALRALRRRRPQEARSQPTQAAPLERPKATPEPVQAAPASKPKRAADSAGEVAPSPSDSASVPAESASTAANAPPPEEVGSPPPEKPVPPASRPSALPPAVEPPQKSGTDETAERPPAPAPGQGGFLIRHNERAAAERLIRLLQIQARTKRETGRYLSARELLEKRPALGQNLVGDGQWIARGYRFVLKVPARNFFFAVAVPLSYGKSGLHSFYIDARGMLRGGDKKGRPATPSDPVLKRLRR